MKYFILCLAICTLLPCCKKDPVVAVSKKDLITKAVWVYESGGIDQGKNGTIDISFETIGFPPVCVLDNKGTFNANGTGINDEGTTKCQASDPASTNFTWALANNETEVIITGNGLGGLSGNFKMNELSETRFSLAKDTTLFGTAAALILNLKH